jgi:hypothetical protein
MVPFLSRSGSKDLGVHVPLPAMKLPRAGVETGALKSACMIPHQNGEHPSDLVCILPPCDLQLPLTVRTQFSITMNISFAYLFFTKPEKL